jgi:HlyD family secretion protein
MSWACSFAVLAWMFPACADATSEAFPGYVEGEYAALAPVASARIKDLRVRRGDRVVPGAVVATLETEDTQLAITKAEGAVAEAVAQLENLRKGRRGAEIEAIEASLESAKAQARMAALTLDRQKNLVRRGASAQANMDQAQAEAGVANAKVKEIEANLAVARMPARDDEIMAAEQRLAQAKAALDQARWQERERTLVATVRGRVYDIIRRPGEIAGPSQPIVSVLPDGATLIRFYAPETQMSRLPIGATVAVACDQCPPDLTARITYRASEPEFTPPVIYSIERRQKLVFLLEARPEAPVPALEPGQIVTVRPPTDE